LSSPSATLAALHPTAGASAFERERELSRPAVLLSVALALAAGALVFPALVRHTGGYLFRGDGAAYFMMARSLVVDGDTDLTDEYAQLDARLPPGSDVLMAVRFSARRVPASGRTVLPWPIGGGLAMAPFYAAGYAAELASARLAGRPPDSNGLQPQLFYGACALAYGLLGFWATFLLCRRLADPAAAALAALAMVLASPALFYLLFHPTMSHAASFGLAALLALLWWRRWEAGELRLVPLCLLLGLMVLVRYQNAVFALLPLSLFWKAARSSRLPWRSLLRAAAAGALAGLAPLALQAAHLARSGELAAVPAMWRARGGLTQSENGFDLASPNFLRVLVSCQHGAFYWTPVMALGFAALLWAAVRAPWARVLAALFLADAFVVGCLGGDTNWSGDHAFGMRYLTESAPLLAAGLAALIARRPAPEPAPGRTAVTLRHAGWGAALGLLIAGNGLLVLAFATSQIDHERCVTYGEMAAGVSRALAQRPPPAGGGR
jgi:hypothetical protein